ncbi:MAG: hypothetical protein HON47_00150, partial [Candidatus Diapherotrites archaeon]|nr:hypothetical protein [Candidatus Diapherotrites archaeon]
MKIQLKITISLLAILMLTSFVIAGECDNYSGSYIYTENIPSEESDGCDWKNLDSRDPIQNLKTLNNHYGYWGCDDSSTQVTYCLITSCDGVGQACGTNTGECVAGNYVCSTSGLYCNGAVEPTAESLDGLDNDCDGTVDNVVNLKNPKYFPNTWYTANSNFSMLESEKNCSQVSDNTDDGWSAPQNICSYGNGSTSCSNGCSGNYLIVKPSVPQTAPVSQISSVKLLVYFTPRGASHSGENINIGLRVGSANYGVDFDVTNSSPKTIDLTSKKNWSWNDLKNAVIYMKLQNPINLDFDLVKLWVSGYGCAGSEVVCDGIDDDCDGQTDEGVKNTYFLDFDNDNSGSILNSQLACSAPNNYVSNADDCDDSNPNIKPTATENITNGVDDDCDGLVDEGKTKQTVCVGSKPSNSEYNYGTTNGNFTQTWDGVNWDPTTMDYHHNNVAEECAWKCSSG